MEKTLQTLFVYGSLRSGFKHPAYEYMAKYFDLVGPATVRGKMYDMGSYPAAIPCDDDAWIIGELYQLKNEKEFTWAFEQLDDYEGVSAFDDQPAMYKRDTVTVNVHNETFAAWIYWFNGTIEDQPLISSGDILEFIQHKSKL